MKNKLQSSRLIKRPQPESIADPKRRQISLISDCRFGNNQASFSSSSPMGIKHSRRYFSLPEHVDDLQPGEYDDMNVGQDSNHSDTDKSSEQLSQLLNVFTPKEDRHIHSATILPDTIPPSSDLWRITVLQSKDTNIEPTPPLKLKSRKVPAYMLEPLAPPGLVKIIPPADTDDGPSYPHAPIVGSPTSSDTPPPLPQSSLAIGLPSIWSPPHPSPSNPPAPSIPPYIEPQAPLAPVLSHQILPSALPSAIPSSFTLDKPPDQSNVIVTLEEAPCHYSNSPYSMWTPEGLTRIRRTFLDHLARKKKNNPYVPVMVSPFNPLRDRAPTCSWTELPSTPGRAPQKFKIPLEAVVSTQRSRHSCDTYCELAPAASFLSNRHHCRECRRDNLGKKLLSLRYLQRCCGVLPSAATQILLEPGDAHLPIDLDLSQDSEMGFESNPFDNVYSDDHSDDSDEDDSSSDSD